MSLMQNPLADAPSDEEEEEDVFRKAGLEKTVGALHAGLILAGMGTCLVGAAYALYYKWAFITLGCMMLGAGAAGSWGSFQRLWLWLFVVNCVHCVILVLLLIFVILAGIIAFDIRDPVTESVAPLWVDLRPELESSEFCRESPGSMPSCTLFYSWASKVRLPNATRNSILVASGDTPLANVCPHKIDDMAVNCSMVAACDTSKSRTQHEQNCYQCDSECQQVLIDDLRGNIGAIGNFLYFLYVWVLCVLAFNVRLTGIAADVDDWNEYMAGEAKRRGVVEYTEERLQGTSVQRLGLVINLIMLLTGLVVAVLAAFILAMYAEAFSNIATCLLLIGLSMVVTSIFLMYGAVTATTAVMKAGNIVLLLISMLFLFLAIMTSMASGNVDDLHKTVKDDWPKMQAKLTHEDPLYCSGQTEAQCKDKFMDEVTANVSTLFGVLFVMLLYEAVMIVITNSVTVSMFHGSGGSLKDKVMGMTQHERKLPQSERIKMMKNRVKPLPMTIEQTEAAVISEEEDDPDADPEDEEAADLLHKGDEQLHTGDLKGALDLYVQAQLIEPGNVKLRSRVRNARRQLAVEMDFQMQVALYDDTEIAEDEAAVKMQAAARGRIEKNRLNKQKEAAIKIQRVQRGKAARAKNASE